MPKITTCTQAKKAAATTKAAEVTRAGAGAVTASVVAGASGAGTLEEAQDPRPLLQKCLSTLEEARETAAARTADHQVGTLGDGRPGRMASAAAGISEGDAHKWHAEAKGGSVAAGPRSGARRSGEKRVRAAQQWLAHAAARAAGNVPAAAGLVAGLVGLAGWRCVRAVLLGRGGALTPTRQGGEGRREAWQGGRQVDGVDGVDADALHDATPRRDETPVYGPERPTPGPAS